MNKLNKNIHRIEEKNMRINHVYENEEEKFEY